MYDTQRVSLIRAAPELLEAARLAQMEIEALREDIGDRPGRGKSQSPAESGRSEQRSHAPRKPGNVRRSEPSRPAPVALVQAAGEATFSATAVIGGMVVFGSLADGRDTLTAMAH